MHIFSAFLAAIFVFVFQSPAHSRALFSYIEKSVDANITVVFVHGLTSDARSSWTNENSKGYWPYIVSDDDELDAFNVAVLDYESFLRDGLPVEGIAAKSLDAFRNNVSTDQKLVFVGHSLGGIIVREMILQEPEIAKNTLGIVTFATPMAGSELTSWARLIGFNGPVVAQLEPSVDSNYVTRLLRRWSRLQNVERIPVHCSSEGKKTGSFIGLRGPLVVDQSSAFTSCTHTFKDWPGHDHNSINKPRDEFDQLHVWLKQILVGLPS